MKKIITIAITLTLVLLGYAQQNVLFIVGNASLSDADQAINDRLETLFDTVTVIAAASSSSGDASGKDLIFISSTITSTDVGSKFTNSAVPLINCEHAVHDDLEMTSTTGHGSQVSVTQLAIILPSHPLAGGLEDTVTVHTSSHTFTWGLPNTNAAKVATVVGDTGRVVIFGFEEGAEMDGINAPARRVGFYFNDNSADIWTADGQTLFDAAIAWALGDTSGGGGNVSPVVSITSPSNGATFASPADITITANASDSDGSVVQVEFFFDTSSIGIDTSSPYSITWEDVPEGSYSLTAVATDDGDSITTSAAVNITVVEASVVWSTQGNVTDSASFLGTINHQPLIIKTDSIDRIIVGVNDTIEFKGTALFDSIKIPNGFIQADSIRARVIHVGDSSILIGGGNQVGNTNEIITTTTAGTATLEIRPGNGWTVFANNVGSFSDARVGIGTNNPAQMLHIDRSTNTDVLAQFTNTVTSNPGFRVGVDASGNAILKHTASGAIGNMNFYTENTQRMTIIGNAGATAGFVGIGPAFSPLQTLDVNGTAAIRSVAQNDNLDRILVWDNTNNGLVQWRDASTIGVGNVSTCSTASFPADDDYLTKWSSADEICSTIVYEDASTRIGIAINNNLDAKLHVQNSTENKGILSISDQVTTAAVNNIGVQGQSSGSDFANTGIKGISKYTSTVTPPNLYNIGAHGVASGSTFQNIGGAFEADRRGGLNIGVYGSGVDLAGYFNGSVVRTGTDNFTSDINLKDSIEDVSSALSVLAQLLPKTFIFKTDSFPYMNLPSGTQLGFIAQQMDSIIPELVDSIITPEIRDSAGNTLMEQSNFLTINIDGLIPLLVSGINELNAKTITTATTPTDSNYITKWSGTSGVLSTGVIYDDGERVGIGTATPDPVSTLDVQGDTLGGKFHGILSGIYGAATADTAAGEFFDGNFNGTGIISGVMGFAGATSDTLFNTGMLGVALGSEIGNAGMAGFAELDCDSCTNVGMAGYAENSGHENRGGTFRAQPHEGDTTAVNYGIVSEATGSAPKSYAGYFEGDVTISGTLYEPSDRKLKNNIRDLGNTLDILAQLQPKDYEYRTADYRYMNLPQRKQYGLIAEDVEQVIPELVNKIISPEHRDKRGNVLSPRVDYKGINYIGLIPFLINGIKEQQALIDSLDSRLEAIEAQGRVQFKVTDPIGLNDDEPVNHLTVELSSMQYIVLEQNVPNPFAEQTSISYFIPEDAGTATILFVDRSGRVIKTVDVEKGYGIMTVFASNLSSGTYSYSLLIDGRVIETKKMVKMR